MAPTPRVQSCVELAETSKGEESTEKENVEAEGARARGGDARGLVCVVGSQMKLMVVN